MNKLANTAFHFCSNAKKKGLKDYEVLSLAEGQLDTLESIKVQNVYRNSLSGEMIDIHTKPLAGLF